jgi:hypothetical protein
LGRTGRPREARARNVRKTPQLRNQNLITKGFSVIRGVRRCEKPSSGRRHKNRGLSKSEYSDLNSFCCHYGWMNSVTPPACVPKNMTPGMSRVIPSTAGEGGEGGKAQLMDRIPSKPAPPVAGLMCTLSTTRPPSEPLGRNPPRSLKLPGVQLMTSSAVHVPNPRRVLPSPERWTKEPPPVAFPEGLVSNEPDPAKKSLSPLAAAVAMSGQEPGPTMVHMGSVPTRNCRFGLLFANEMLVSERESRSRPSASAEIFSVR